ncbi:metacaspase-1 [Entomortierella parvispora]|uniref:Metacaspase-1 n=1 Tax=Entomortierella parvispora TaxID=205924 RepID=A0A9P3H1R0_9FUNG|nr:metacaspase-1 [Entomortierella parvispora]
MSQPQEQGEPIVNVETVVTVLPDGRKVTKTIKKITHSYQVKVPAGTPVPEGATLISTVAAEGSHGFGNGNGQGQGHQIQYSAGNPGIPQEHAQPHDYKPFTNFNETVNSQFGDSGVVKTEPTVVVESSIGPDGRKVTKTTTTTSSSSSSGSPSSLSKFFKRFSLHSGDSSSDLKPLPAAPVAHAPVHIQAQAQVQAQPETLFHKPHPPLPIVQHEVTSEVKNVRVKREEAKHADGSRVALSNCSGERRALLIGINYTGMANPLHGCVNDTAVMKNFLLGVGFEDENIRILTDDQHNTPWMPTRQNIFDSLSWLIRDAKKNDSYFLHYSGHGGQVEDLDGDETDGMDNCIFPLDHQQSGVIIDDELHNVLVKALPPGVRLTVVFDCCHSGSALDLPYMYASTGYIRGSNALQNLGHELVEGNFDAEALKELQHKWQILQEEEKEFARQVKLKAADADVIMFSGCKDDQTSADVSITRGGNTSSNGAMTYAFTKCIRENPVQSYQEMLNNIRDLLKDRYKQRPQLSSSRPMNMQELFHM